MFTDPENRTDGARSRTRFYFAIVLMIATIPSAVSVEPIGSDLSTRTVELRLIDEHQEPVSGASVTAIGLKISGLAGTIRETGRDSEPTHRSDDLGRIIVEAPSMWRGTQTVDAVVCRISHNDFVTFSAPVSFKDSPATLRLERGRRIALSAVDNRTHNRITRNLYAILSNGPADQQWQHLSSGMLVSEGVAFDRTQLRLIQLAEDNLPRFSRLIDLREHGRNRRILLHDIVIHDGFRLEGNLDPKVPRPIRNGIIRVVVSGDGNDWYDGCDIRDDGTFEIDSLPAGEVVQLTAVCDGWVSANPTKEQMAAIGMANQFRRIQPSRLYPQVLRSDEELTRPVIPMNQAANCRVQVLDTSGKPIPNALVRLQPFQGSYDGRSLYVGQGQSTRSLLLQADVKAQQSASGAPPHVLPRRQYSASTNANGIAVVTSLPGGPDGSPAMTPVYVSHPQYEHPPHDGLGDRGLFRAALYLGQTAKLRFQLRQKN